VATCSRRARVNKCNVLASLAHVQHLERPRHGHGREQHVHLRSRRLQIVNEVNDQGRAQQLERNTDAEVGHGEGHVREREEVGQPGGSRGDVATALPVALVSVRKGLVVLEPKPLVQVDGGPQKVAVLQTTVPPGGELAEVIHAPRRAVFVPIDAHASRELELRHLPSGVDAHRGEALAVVVRTQGAVVRRRLLKSSEELRLRGGVL